MGHNVNLYGYCYMSMDYLHARGHSDRGTHSAHHLLCLRKISLFIVIKTHIMTLD